MSEPERSDQVEANRRNWDERAPIHAASAFYDLPGFLAGRSSLQDFETEEMGDVAGLELVHLQCHIGLDTLSWARRGARVTGVDFSAPALRIAEDLASQLGLPADFVLSEVTGAAAALAPRRFDVVYTGHGALVWLPDLEAWADNVVGLLKPGGRLYLAEFHPFSQMLGDDDLTVAHSGFSDEAMVVDEPGTYADFDAPTTANLSYEWTHPLGEVVTVLARRGMRIEYLHERDIIAWPRWRFLEKFGSSWPDGWWRMPGQLPRVPLSYTLSARLT